MKRMAETRIEWADRVWNPVTGCTPISEGCQNCYAKRMNIRLAGRCGYPKDNPFAVTMHLDKLDDPLSWKKPRSVFVCNMGDLFHEDVDFSFIRRIWATMTTYPRQHTYLILTKRPERMKQFFEWMDKQDFKVETFWDNIWLGVTAENQARADERIPILLQIPAAKRFVSIEPILGPVCLTNIDAEMAGHENMYFVNALTGRHDDMGRPCNKLNKLDWVICGGETGPGARPMHPDWARSLRDQCQAAGVPFFFKQWGEWSHEYPQQLYLAHRAQTYQRGTVFHKVGKKNSGRLLDGQEWNQLPEVRQ